jgi:hypothetical protein
MKLKLAILSTVLAFLLTSVSFAAENSKHLTIASPVQVGSTTLQPGDYNVTWSGNGPSVNVTFAKGKKTVATAPAKLENATPNNQTSVETTHASNNQELKKINWPHVSLDFNQGGSGSSSPSAQ